MSNRIFLFINLLLNLVVATVLAEKKINMDFYIVFLRDHQVNETLTRQKHLSVLSSLKGSELDASESHVYSYTKHFNAFAAKLSEGEATKLRSMDGVVSVLRNQYRKPQTTRSWDFIGLTPNSPRNFQTESNIIIGLFDTGITPQSESFNDRGFGPPPAKWKGSCGPFVNFSGCNNKLIGAKYFKLDNVPDPDDILSPIDVLGHGTHTSSTAAGNLVPNANLFGLAQGTARGAVPSARIAMYKVCWGDLPECQDMDILAAFEAAISDGVDFISISLGGIMSSYTEDVISIGAFHAFRKGILTVASGGNDGPGHGTVQNFAPWIMTVAASGIDRAFRSKLVLGNGVALSGVGVSTIEPKQRSYPLASGADTAYNSSTLDLARRCYGDYYMDPSKVEGKIMYCEDGYRRLDVVVVKFLGGVGTVLVRNLSLQDDAPVFMAPTTIVDPTIGESIKHYINSTRAPSAVIHKSKEIKINAPFVASFSSRGPNPGSPLVLKPDIAAPGIDILAAYTPLNSITETEFDTLHSKFNIMSGTSMACPHVAGAAAYVKSFHPSWSPSAIVSALMTTATPMVDKDAEFAYGSGQVNPTQAIRPGLVYDMDYMSYIQFLCNDGYNGSSISHLVGDGSIISCSKFLPPDSEDALNYPTMQMALKSSVEPTVVVFWRTVTNVGFPGSYYKASIEAPDGVEITVTPRCLLFWKGEQKRRFKVVVKANPMAGNVFILSGSITWKSADTKVRSPVVVYNPLAK